MPDEKTGYTTKRLFKTEMEITIDRNEEQNLRKTLGERNDAEAHRLMRFLKMSDLTRTPGNPIHELIGHIIALPYFAGFDVIDAPEIVPADISFDLFNFPPDHPVRSASDTYYVDPKNILRTHTTVMWYYYVNSPEIREKIKNSAPLKVFSYGKVYRKDEIDRHHMNIFHQLDGLYLAPSKEKTITPEDLEEALAEVARGVFGPEIKYRFNRDTFPYTDPSIEMEVEVGGNWIEVLGGGLVRPVVLQNFGIDPTQYNGWAFGFGLERLAIISMELPDIRLLWSCDPRVVQQLKLGTKYKEVSKYPPIIRDISFVVDSDFIPNNYFDLIRDIGGDLVEEVKLLDRYEDAEKFGPGKISYTYRITYRSNERTLTTEEIDPLQERVYRETAETFHATLR